MKLRAFVLFASILAACALLAAHARDGRLRERLAERLQPRAGIAAVDATAGLVGAIRAPGLYHYALTHEGIERKYLVHVPRGYVPGRPMPVLFAFHGGGGHMEFQASNETYGLRDGADVAGFITVFPNGIGRLPNGRLATWNAGDCCGDARDGGVDDVGFVRRVHADVARRLTTQPGRVFATGMSNGGMMAYRLACEAPDLVRAIAAVAGTDVTRTCTPARPVGVLHIHARDDSHVLFEGGAGPDAFRNRSKISDYTSVPATIAKWTRLNGCSAPPRRVLERDGAWCELHARCDGGARVQLCVTEGGGHSWPGGGTMRGKVPSRALSANETLFAFFAGF